MNALSRYLFPRDRIPIRGPMSWSKQTRRCSRAEPRGETALVLSDYELEREAVAIVIGPFEGADALLIRI